MLRIVLPIVHIATCFPSCQYPDEIYLLGFYTLSFFTSIAGLVTVYYACVVMRLMVQIGSRET